MPVSPVRPVAPVAPVSPAAPVSAGRVSRPKACGCGWATSPEYSIFASASIRDGGTPTLTQEQLDAACGEARATSADMILVTADGDAFATAEAIAAARPDLRAFTNEQMIGRIEQGGFATISGTSKALTVVG